MKVANFQCRPIDQWPGEFTKVRKDARFKQNYGATLDLLHHELDMIKAQGVVLLMALYEDQIRLDGRPRGDCKPAHPGIILCCTTKFGPLRMPCDRYKNWQDNLRAIALSLEALRTVDRHGCTKRGEQYRGWTSIAAGDERDFPTAEDAIAFLRKILGLAPGERGVPAELIRTSMFKAHPDHGGSEAMMKQVLKAKAKIEGSMR